jgi:hypothetical protein
MQLCDTGKRDTIDRRGWCAIASAALLIVMALDKGLPTPLFMLADYKLQLSAGSESDLPTAAWHSDMFLINI